MVYSVIRDQLWTVVITASRGGRSFEAYPGTWEENIYANPPIRGWTIGNTQDAFSEVYQAIDKIQGGRPNRCELPRKVEYHVTVERYKNGGSQVVTLRIEDDLLSQIDEHLARTNLKRRGAARSRAKLIRDCITEVLGKSARSAKSRARKGPKKERHDQYGETI